jgi:hypothetical protein
VSNQAQLNRIREVKEAHEAELLDKANVVGIGIGTRERGGESTEEFAIVVSVTRKLPASELDSRDILPERLDGVPVDVRAVGELKAGQ